MIYGIKGYIQEKEDGVMIIETAAGIVFKVHSLKADAESVLVGHEVKVECVPYFEQFDIYGFLHREDKHMFSLLTSISGIGPKNALKIMNGCARDILATYIAKEQSRELSLHAGISQKTASKIVLELKDKVVDMSGGNTQSTADVYEALHALGYSKKDIHQACQNIPESAISLEEQVRAALKFLSKRN